MKIGSKTMYSITMKFRPKSIVYSVRMKIRLKTKVYRIRMKIWPEPAKHPAKLLSCAFLDITVPTAIVDVEFPNCSEAALFSFNYQVSFVSFNQRSP